MCGRYYVDDEDLPEELSLLIAELQRRTGEPIKLGEIFPTQTAPVIANNRGGKPTPFLMRWGFSLRGAPIINARSETAAHKPLFCESMARRRCLIPASYYFEWKKQGTQSVKYAIGAGKPLYMAGLYRIEETTPVFTILTRAPAENISFIHNRMPVILPKDAHSAWLNDGQNAEDTLKNAVTDVRFKIA